MQQIDTENPTYKNQKKNTKKKMKPVKTCSDSLK